MYQNEVYSVIIYTVCFENCDKVKIVQMSGKIIFLYLVAYVNDDI